MGGMAHQAGRQPGPEHWGPLPLLSQLCLPTPQPWPWAAFLSLSTSGANVNVVDLDVDFMSALQTGGGGGSYASELAYVPNSWFSAGLSSSRYPPHPHPTQQQTSGWPTAHPVLGLLGKGAPKIPGQ